MDRTYIEDKTFISQNFSTQVFLYGEYDTCTFIKCNFSGIDLSGVHFSDCVFDGCDLTTAKLVQAAFKNVTFKECKLLGLHFEDCSRFLFCLDFYNCILNLSSFNGLSLKKRKFDNCQLHEVDFTDADLSESVFTICDFRRTIFLNTNLEKADFSTSFNYSIDPESNKLKKAKFSLPAVIGLLDKYQLEISR